MSIKINPRQAPTYLKVLKWSVVRPQNALLFIALNYASYVCNISLDAVWNLNIIL